MSAVVQITSPEHLQEQLGADLNRLSILSFRAEWAEPCKQMDEVVRELAKKYQQALFLEVCSLPASHSEAVDDELAQIEAESLPDISESFEVESVPFFILLRVRLLLFTLEKLE